MSGRLLVVGEALVEIMRPRPCIPLGVTGQFVGPFPSGAPAIAADAAARAGADVALFAAVGAVPFGRLPQEGCPETGLTPPACAAAGTPVPVGHSLPTTRPANAS